MASAVVVRPIYGVLGPARPEAYRLDLGLTEPVYVLGPYPGGASRFRYADVVKIVDRYTQRGHVLFEGVIMGSVFGKLGRYLASQPGAHVVFLTTSAAQCVANVRARRLARGNRKPFDPKLVLAKHAHLERLQTRFRAAGVSTVPLTSDDVGGLVSLFAGTATK